MSTWPKIQSADLKELSVTPLTFSKRETSTAQPFLFSQRGEFNEDFPNSNTVFPAPQVSAAWSITREQNSLMQ